jgi:hypothetical protein
MRLHCITYDIIVCRGEDQTIENNAEIVFPYSNPIANTPTMLRLDDMNRPTFDIKWFYMAFSAIKYQHIYEANANNNIVILNGRQ